MTHRRTCDGLRASYWPSEILQVMFWLKSEGFGDEAEVAMIERFLGVDARLDALHLDRLVEEGYLERADGRYKLSEAGLQRGSVEFAAWYEEVMEPNRVECGKSAWCQSFCHQFQLFE